MAKERVRGIEIHYLYCRHHVVIIIYTVERNEPPQRKIIFRYLVRFTCFGQFGHPPVLG